MILELFYGEVTAAEVLKKKCVWPRKNSALKNAVKRNEDTPKRKAYQ